MVILCFISNQIPLTPLENFCFHVLPYTTLIKQNAASWSTLPIALQKCTNRTPLVFLPINPVPYPGWPSRAADQWLNLLLLYWYIFLLIRPGNYYTALSLLRCCRISLPVQSFLLR